MKCLVFSDSHHKKGKLRQAFLREQAISPIDVLIFCGDGYGDADEIEALCPLVWKVRGNCDISAPDSLPLERVERLGSHFVLICHGHRYQVKYSGLDALAYRARESDAEIVLYGHTHQQGVKLVGKVLCVNPGAMQDGKYAILSLDKTGAPTVTLKQLQD